ncbi:YukJ family protein [Salinifilum aidingensis]
MPLQSYGVLTARVVDTRREGGSDDTPHYQIHLTDDAGTHYRAAVNVKSAQPPWELLYFAADDFRHPLTAHLPEAGSGWNALPSQPDGASLDYVRADLVRREQMRPVPAEADGPGNDLADFLDHHVHRAKQDPSAHAYVFGEPWGPEEEPDEVFGFQPGNGVHSVHMNQGNSEEYRDDNGVWQDGGLLLHFAGEDRWVAIFLAFQSQAWRTDDETGHPLEGAGARSEAEESPAEGSTVVS